MMKVNILFFASTAGQGLDYHLTRLAIALKRQGVHVVAISSNGEQERDLHKELKNEGIELFRSNVDRIPPKRECINLIRHIVLTNEINVVHVQGILTAILAYIAVRPLSRRPKIVCRFNSYPRLLIRSNLIFNIVISKLLSRLVHVVIVPSNIVKQKLKMAGFSEKKISLIYNGLDVEKFFEYAQNTLPSNLLKLFSMIEEKKIIVYMASMLSNKGHKYAIKAIPQVLRSYHNSVFIFAGGGPIKTKLKRMTQRLGVNGNVFFLERIPYKYVSSLLFKSDIVIFPSLKETFGRAIIEALAAGKPIVATPVGVAPEIVEIFKVGLLVPKKDFDALGNAVIKLLESESKPEETCLKRQKIVKEHFDTNAISMKIKCLYSSLIS